MPLCDAIYHDLHYEDHTGNINGCDRYDDGSYKNLNNAKIKYTDCFIEYNDCDDTTKCYKCNGGYESVNGKIKTEIESV